jgi:L-fuculose-phosphate aldolase
MRFDLQHQADQLVMMMNRIYYRGMTTTSGGNLSIMDEFGDIWITPSGVDKGMLTRDDIVQIKPDGTVLGHHKPSSEHPFHEAVYRCRPDIKAVLHAHSPAVVSFSALHILPEIYLIPNIKLICGEITIAPYALPGSEALGKTIAAEFAKGFSVVILENHGVVIGADSIFSAFMAFETLEYCSQLHINALKLGELRPLNHELIDSLAKTNDTMPEFIPDFHTSEEKALRRDLIKFIHRSYEQALFTSTQGTYSARLSDGSFLITPFGLDRQYLEAEDLVLIRDGQKEKGKRPSRSVTLHQEIYSVHPEIRSILIAHPPSIMAFAVTDAEFDPRTIPESYIVLREPEKAEFGDSYRQPKKLARMISDKVPVVICKNDCVIITGSSLLNAFDRLEVAEFTAKSIIASKGVGEIMHIKKSDIDDINAAFHLKD